MKYRLNEKVNVYTAANTTSTLLEELGAGCEVSVGEIVRTGPDEWQEVILADGKRGYIPARTKGSKITPGPISNLAKGVFKSIGILLVIGGFRLLFTEYVKLSGTPNLLAPIMALCLGMFFVIRSYAAKLEPDLFKIRAGVWPRRFVKLRNWSAFSICAAICLFALGADVHQSGPLNIGSILFNVVGICIGFGAVWAMSSSSNFPLLVTSAVDALLNVLLLVGLCSAMVYDRQHKEQIARLREVSSIISNSQVEAMSTFSTNPEAGEQKMVGLIGELEKRSARTSGSEHALLVAIAEAGKKGMEWGTNWDQACRTIDAALNISDVSTPEQFQDKKNLLATAFGELDSLRSFQFEEILSGELMRQNIKIDPNAFASAASTMRPRQALMDRMVTALADYAEHVRQMQNWYDSNWGSWTLNATNGQMKFKSQTTAQAYRLEKDRLEKAGAIFSDEVKTCFGEMQRLTPGVSKVPQ